MRVEGKTFTATRTKTVVKDGQKVKEVANRTVRPWWWAAGKSLFVQIRYGASLLTFKGGTNAIETNSLKGVVTVLTTVKQAVENGELDASIAAVTSKRTAKKAAAK